MTTGLIAQIARQGIRSLIDAMDKGYWPAKGINDMSERNITVHVGHAFVQAKWYVLAEVSFPGQGGQRLDMLALHEPTRSMVAIEAKRLETGVKAKELSNDAKRIMRFRIDNDNSGIDLLQRSRYGLLLAFTWTPEIHGWWMNKWHSSPPKGCSGLGWKPLGKRLDDYKAEIGSIKLPGYGREGNSKYEHFWGLYAIFKLR